MGEQEIYPVWKPYTPEQAPEGLRFNAGTYRMFNGQWERLEPGTCQEFINQLHEQRKRENLPIQNFTIPIDWLTRPFIDENIDGQ